MKNSKDEIRKRHDQIVTILFERGAVSTDELAEILSVSSATIRHDFEILSQENKVRRTFGGAEFAGFRDEAHVSAADSLPQKTNETRKRLSGKAASMIEDGDNVLVNSSVTLRFLLDYLTAKKTTIITNNRRLLQKASEDINLISTGGAVNNVRNSLCGPIAFSTVEKTLANKCILGVRSISAETGITLTEMEESQLASLMIAHTTGEVIVAVEGFKVGQRECYIAENISKIDCLITDSSADETELQKIRDAGVKVYIV